MDGLRISSKDIKTQDDADDDDHYAFRSIFYRYLIIFESKLSNTQPT
jgi:hypothetical protein